MSVRDRVVVEGVRDDDGGGFGVTDKVSAEVLERTEFRRKARVGEGEVVVQGMDVAHGGERDSRREQEE